MSRLSRKFKVMGLALMVVSAFSAFAAAAQAAPQFTVGGSKVTTTVPLRTTTVPGDFVLRVPSLPLEVTCTELHIESGAINSPTDVSATSLVFTNCVVSSNPTKCQVTNVGGTVGTIVTGALTGTLATVGTGTDLLLSPAATNFVELEVTAKAGQSCPVSGKYKIAGTAAVKMTTGTNATTVSGESSEAIQKAYDVTAGAVKLTVGAKEAFLSLSTSFALESDGNWGVDA